MTRKSEVKTTLGRGLTPRQKMFVDEYLVDLNATQAAIRAGYSEKTANEQGARLLANVSISEAIAKAQQDRKERTLVTQDMVIKGLLDIIAMSTGKQDVVETEVVKTEDGEVTGVDVIKTCFEPAAANRALELLGKHLGMFTEKVETVSKVEVSSLSDLMDELADEYRTTEAT